jgi:hypothetical protein
MLNQQTENGKPKWKRWMSWSVLACVLLVATLLGTSGISIVDKSDLPAGAVGIGIGEEKVITLGSPAYAAGSVDYTFDGTDDDVQFQAALNALPATGGRLVVVSSTTINFSATVSRAIDDVVIQGSGAGTYFANDGGTAIFDAGVQSGWIFRDFSTDAGGLDVATATQYRLENVTLGTTYYPGSARTATFTVAAPDAPSNVIAQADYTSIASAIAALPSDGGDVYLSVGTHEVSTQIDLPAKHVRIVGSGMDATTVKLTADISYMFDIATVTYGGMESLTLDGDKASRGSGTAFHGRPYQYIFRDVHIKNFADHGIYFENAGAGGDTETTIDRCILWGIDGNAIYSDLTSPCSAVHVQATWFQENNCDYYGRGQWWTFDNRCIFSGTTGGASIQIYNDSSHCKISNCRFQDTQYGLVLFSLAGSTAQNFEFSYNTIEECNAGDNAGQKVVEIDHSTGSLSHILIAHNIMDDANAHQTFANFLLSDGGDDLTVVGNDYGGATITTPISHDATEYTIVGIDDFRVTRTATYVVAASDAPAHVKAQADYVCDGTADGVQWNAAIVAANAAGGGVVRGVGYTFNIAADEHIDLLSNVTIEGDGWSTVFKKASSPSDLYIFKATGTGGSHLSNIGLRNLKIDNNNTSETNFYNIYGIYVDGVTIDNICSYGGANRCGRNYFAHTDDLRLTRSTFSYCYQFYLYGIVTPLDDTDMDSVDIYVAGNKLEYTHADSPALLLSGDHITVTGNVIGNVPNTGLDLSYSPNVSVMANTIYSVGASGSKPAIYSEGGRNLSISANTIRDCYVGIQIKNALGISQDIANSDTIIGNSIYNSGFEAIEIFGQPRVNIIGNLIHTTTKHGILISQTGALYSDYCRVIDNSIFNFGTVTAQSKAISLSQADYCDILNNRIDGNSVATADYGIYETTSDYNHIEGNRIENIDTTNIVTVGANTTVRNNPGFIAVGEVQSASGSLTGGAQNEILFAWHNPYAQDIFVKKVVIYLTTADPDAPNIDVGRADDASYTNGGTEFFNDLAGETAYTVRDSWVGGDGGTQTKWFFIQDSASATDGWVVAKITDADGSSIVGSYYIEYVGK